MGTLKISLILTCDFSGSGFYDAVKHSPQVKVFIEEKVDILNSPTYLKAQQWLSQSSLNIEHILLQENVTVCQTINVDALTRKENCIRQKNEFCKEYVLNQEVVKRLDVCFLEILQNTIDLVAKSKAPKPLANLRFLKLNDKIGIHATDSAGQLKKEMFLTSLGRGANDGFRNVKGEGAGVGWSMIVQNTSGLFVDVAEGTETQVLCLIPNSKRFRESEEQPKLISLNWGTKNE